MIKNTQVQNITLNDSQNCVVILDQRQLPNRTEFIHLRTAEEMFEAIKDLKVRGAPAIGIFAAYCLYVLAKTSGAKDHKSLCEYIGKQKDYLNSSRPTAVNLNWALGRMEKIVLDNRDKPVQQIVQLMGEEAKKIHDEDIAMCRAISEHGLSLIRDGDGILTHCNAGPLATSRYGTALGPMLLGRERGMNFRVFSDETRPLLQGARLTCYELHKAGIDVTLICDSTAGMVMKNGWIQACFVGCDRVAANGDVANKIGTSGVAILAKYYGIPFYVLGPTSTIDKNCSSGDKIEIELRDPAEIREKFYKEPMALKEVKCYNPAFDITDHSLISGIVTEKGICRPPYAENLGALFG